jgi:hypothetical protein
MKTIPQLEDEIEQLHKLYDKLAKMYNEQKDDLAMLRQQIGVLVPAAELRYNSVL